METITILLAEDHKIVREGLRNLIDLHRPDMEVVAEADDGRTAVQLARKICPRVVLMDIAMPGLNGIDATRQIVADNTDIKVIALSMHSDKHFITEMFKAGASGYLLKDCAFEELIQAIRSVVANKSYMSAHLAGALIKDHARVFQGKKQSAFSSLNSREREVLQLLSEGKNSREIADSIKLSQKTVESYRHQIMTKLDIHSIAELTKYAIREGLTSPDA
jgi:DNA-binding NarL/FixJ family response regulator